MRIYYKVNIVYDKSNIIISNSIKKITSLLEKHYIDYSINKEENNSINVDIILIRNKIKYKVNDAVYDSIDEVLNNNFIVIRIFKDEVNYEDLITKISNMIYRKDRDKSIQKEKYNRIIKEKFNVHNGLDDIYEWNTGAVYFKDYEIELMGDNKFKKLFLNKNKGGSYLYALPLDTGMMMRGVDTYYYFIAQTSRFQNYSYNHINEWYRNYSKFLIKSLNIINDYRINNQYDLRMLLALVDNVRNYILLLFNSELVINGGYKNNIYYIDESKDNEIDNYAKLVDLYQNIINFICLGSKLENDIIFPIQELIKKTLIMSKKTVYKIKKQPEALLKKCLCKNREMDHYFENLMGCDYAFNSIFIKDDKINLISLLYGGLELPFIVKNTNLISGKINIGLSYQDKGDYLTRQKVNKYEYVDLDKKEYGNVNKNLSTIILDDNIMSGVTMQLLYNELKYHHYNIKCLMGLRHPDLNRLAQIKHFNQVVNIDLVDKYIYGFLFETPYTKIIENTNYNNLFTNRLNFYSVPSKVFLESMYLNGLFTIDSEVDIFKGGEDEDIKNGKTYSKKSENR